MHPALLAGNAARDRGDILLFSLGVGSRRAAQVHFTRLHAVAGIQLVGNGDRNDAEGVDQVAEAFGLLVTAHGEHLDDGGLGAIDAVFGPALALGNPDR